MDEKRNFVAKDPPRIVRTRIESSSRRSSRRRNHDREAAQAVPFASTDKPIHLASQGSGEQAEPTTEVRRFLQVGPQGEVMIEDKLTVEQRIRLESVAQANIARSSVSDMGRGLIDIAAKIEEYILNGKEN
jgi:hypothetical protein